MTLKKIAGKIHLWLGLPTGLVVFIIGITGAIYCFAPELQQMQTYRSVNPENKEFLAPSQIKKIAKESLSGKAISRIYYDAPDKSVMVLFLKKDEYNYSVFINPYNGDVLKVRNNDHDFLSAVLQIHRTLKIPYGHEIISWSTVIFLVLIVTGIILWLPKNKRTVKQGFVIRWKASPKRFNYDLHKVLGFYVSWIAIFAALTGLMFSFEKFAGFVYDLTGAKYSVIQKKPPISDSMRRSNSTNDYISNSFSSKDSFNVIKPGSVIQPIDRIWKSVKPQLYTDYASVMFVFPAVPNGSILIRANPDKHTLYKSDFRYFDQLTGEEIEGAYVWGRYKDPRILADNIRRMNYDFHTGAFFGLPGRIALFFAALIVASLPVTGFYFWWGRRWKSRKGQRHSI
jgi:uncharacterized iron-regulated membrane protein